MSALKRLSAACSTVLVASALVVAPFLTGPATAAELIQDGGFESATGNPLNSPNWTEADSAVGSPICNTTRCSTTGGAARTGNNWVRFGGQSAANHTSSLYQDVVIPVGTASLTYWYRNGAVTTPYTATLVVKVDGTTVKTHTEVNTAQSAYSLQTVDLSSFANGASHRLSFNYTNNASGINTMVVDDVSVNSTPVTATPTVATTVPASPSASSTTPAVKGTAESGSTVTLYSNSTCSSSPLGSGPAASFAGSGITATVTANATTTIYARATKSGQSASACSSTSVLYTHDATAPALVTLTSVTPASPNPSTTPVVKGTAEANSTVKVYATSDCSGTPVATGTAAAFAAPGLTVTVTAGSTTTFRATATDSAANTSACSTSSLTYVSDGTAPPLVTFTGVTPTSPSASTTPVVKGAAETGSTVKLYPTADCTGTPAATGTAAAFAAPGLTVTVAKGSTTTLRATSTDAAGNTSACSTSSITYVNNAAQILLDGGFEATGTVADNPYWVEADTLTGTPLCALSQAACANSGASAGPRTGNAWAWFGGYGGADPLTSSLSQSVVIPVGGAVLTYWFRNGDVSAPFDAQLQVRVDGVTVKTHTEASAAQSAYAQQTVDLAAFADGQPHVLSFLYSNGSAGLDNMTLDDVALNVEPAPATATPTISSVTPVSPSASLTALVTGTSEAGSTVALYGNATCSGAVLGTGTAESFATSGVAATVPAEMTTTIYARAVTPGQNVSACSDSFATYTHRRVIPQTTLTTPPKIKVYRKNRKAKVTFLFASATAGATFQCSVDGKAYVVCVSGKKIKLKQGKHTFAVRAVVGGVVDPTPATYAFKVKRKK